jgi:DNA-binding transcriptional LysR family regulator
MEDVHGALTVRQLQCVLAVVETGSVTAAAEILGISQPSVSQHLARFEQETGLSFFRRRRRGMVPTSAAVAFASATQDVLRHLAEALQTAKQIEAGTSAPLTVGVLSSLATSVVPLSVSQWSAQHGSVPLHFREELRRSNLELAVRRGEVDVGVGHVPVSWNGTIQIIGQEKFVLVVPEGRRQQLGAEANLADLKDDHWVLYESDHGLNEPVMRTCFEAGFRPFDAARTSQVDTAIQLAAVGIGIAVAPAASVPAHLWHLVVVPSPRLTQPIAVWALGENNPTVGQLAAVLAPQFETNLVPDVP